MRALWRDALSLVAVTCGKNGCRWFTRDGSGAVAGFVVTAVDATGAGDAFMAGLLAGLAEAPDAVCNPAALDRICRFANAAGAVTTTARGAIPSLPDRAALERLLSAAAA